MAEEKSKLGQLIMGDEWICLILEKLDIDPALISRVVIDASPGELLEFHLTFVGTQDMLDVRPPESDEVRVQTQRKGNIESSKAGQGERIALGVIKGAQTAQMRPTQNVVQSPFADHIPGLQAQPGQVQTQREDD